MPQVANQTCGNASASYSCRLYKRSQIYLVPCWNCYSLSDSHGVFENFVQPLRLDMSMHLSTRCEMQFGCALAPAKRHSPAIGRSR